MRTFYSMLACFVAHVGLEKNTTQLVKYQPVFSVQPSNKVYVQYSTIMQYNTLRLTFDEFPLHLTPSLLPPGDTPRNSWWDVPPGSPNPDPISDQNIPGL